MAETIIGARKERILRAIIDDYVRTAVPVGSRTISRKYETSLSSATCVGRPGAQRQGVSAVCG